MKNNFGFSKLDSKDSTGAAFLFSTVYSVKNLIKVYCIFHLKVYLNNKIIQYLLN